MYIYIHTGGRTLTQCDIDHHSLIHVLVPASSLPEEEEEEEKEEEEEVATRQGNRQRHLTKDSKHSADLRQGEKIHFLENVLERAELAERRQKIIKKTQSFLHGQIRV
jgi:hypothetical protein